jgi:hypothetical protein
MEAEDEEKPSPMKNRFQLQNFLPCLHQIENNNNLMRSEPKNDNTNPTWAR